MFNVTQSLLKRREIDMFEWLNNMYIDMKISFKKSQKVCSSTSLIVTYVDQIVLNWIFIIYIWESTKY